MAKYDLASVIESNTQDGVVDYTKVWESVNNDYVNPIVTKNKVDVDKLKEQHNLELLNTVGFQSIDEVKKLKDLNDEGKYNDLQKQLDEVNGKYQAELDLKAEVEKDKVNQTQLQAIKQLGYDDDDQVELLHFKLNKQVTDEKDFNSVFEEFKKDNTPKRTDTKFIKDSFGNGDNEFIDAFNAKNKHNQIRK